MTKIIPFSLGLISTCVLLAGNAQAQSLSALLQTARDHDNGYLAARNQRDAAVARADQAHGLLLPQVVLSAGASHNQADFSTPAIKYPFDTQSATISAAQPLYRPQNNATADQGAKQLALAESQLGAAEQDLIVRVSQAYFDHLAAQDTLALVQAQKAAVAEQLAAAQRNFAVGNANVTEQRDAQASFDLIRAQEIAAQNDLRVKQIALDLLIGQSNSTPHPLRPEAVLPALAPEDPQVWADQAEQHSPSLQQAQLALEVAQLETHKAEAGHQPTLDLVGSYTAVNNDGGTLTSNTTSRGTAAQIGLQFNLPLFAGYTIRNRVKETLALEEKARNDLEGARRAVAQSTQTAYFGVASGLAQVQALTAAEASSQSALDANTLGYQVGARATIDVLNAQSQLYATKTKLARARYDVLTGWLRLRQAAGTLQATDADSISDLLTP